MKKKIIIIIVILLLIPVTIYFGFPEVLLKLSINSARDKAGLTLKTLSAAEHSIAYLDGGKGDAIMLLHGLGGSKDNWAKLAKSLTKEYRVIAVDLPGSGESSRIITGIYSITAQVERLDKIVTALKLAKFHIAGNAMGGTIAGMYTVKYPEKILSLAFFNTEGVKSPENSEYSRLIAKGKNILSAKTVEEFDELLKFLFVKPPKVPGPIKKYLLKKAIADRPFNTKIFWDVFGEDYSLEPDLPKIRVKTLIIWGDKDKKLHVSSTKVLEKGLSGSKTVILDNCGHFPMREKPDESAKHYLDFLKK